MTSGVTDVRCVLFEDSGFLWWLQVVGTPAQYEVLFAAAAACAPFYKVEFLE